MGFVEQLTTAPFNYKSSYNIPQKIYFKYLQEFKIPHSYEELIELLFNFNDASLEIQMSMSDRVHYIKNIYKGDFTIKLTIPQMKELYKRFGSKKLLEDFVNMITGEDVLCGYDYDQLYGDDIFTCRSVTIYRVMNEGVSG